VYLTFGARRQESTGVLRQALALAEEHDLPAVALRARVNLAQVSIERDRFAEAVEQVDEALAIARDRGDRMWERQTLGQLMPCLCVLGRWDEAIQLGVPLMAGHADLDAVAAAAFLASIALARGDEATMERCLSLAAERKDSTYVDLRVSARTVFCRDALQRGATEEALSLARDILRERSAASEATEEAFALGIGAALMAGDEQAIAELDAFVAGLPPARATPLLRAGRARLQAELAHRTADEAAAERFEQDAISLLRSVGARPLLAQALLERARRHGDAEALDEARAIYEELDAARWLARIDEASGIPA
jgi:tetratricopeptide (TPR) repeat protein